MMLFVDGISRGVHCTNVGYWVQDYESAFELLTQLVSDDWTLLQAAITDGYDRITVPVEAFDGQPIQVHIHALQQQWNQILSDKPVLSDQLGTPQFKNWYRQLDTYYDALLTYLGKMIFLIEAKKRKLITKRDPELVTRLSRQYALQLDHNRRMYQKTTESRRKNRQRLQEMEAE